MLGRLTRIAVETVLTFYAARAGQLLTAYGAHFIALTPRFVPRFKPLLDDD